MITTFILIVINMQVVTFQEFNSLESCKSASASISRVTNNKVKTYCVPK